MAFTTEQTIRRPHFEVAKWLTKEQIDEINNSLTGFMNSHLNSIGQEKWFSLSSLVGGENEHWPAPIIYVYNAYLAHNPNRAVQFAARDMGWILKKLIKNDKRTFNMKKSYVHGKYVCCYQWV